MFKKIIKGSKDVWCGSLEFDTTPKAGSYNPVTSEGVKEAIKEAVADIPSIEAAIPEGAGEEDQLVKSSELNAVDGRLENVESKIPSSASSTDKLVTKSELDNATASMESGYTPKGPASVSTLNGLTGQENGDQYIVTDSGTLTDGSLAVTAGESVAWDSVNEVWYKVNQYALKSVQVNITENFAPTFDSTRDYFINDKCTYEGTLYIFTSDHPAGAWNPAHATISGQDALLRLTAQNAVDSIQFSVTAETLPQLGDADTFPANSQVRCLNTGIAQQVSHIPVSTQFVCYTFLSGEATPAMQLFICNNANEVYFRRKWSTWGAWERLAFASEAGNLADRFSAYKNYAFGAATVKDGHYLRAIANITAGTFNSEQWESSNVQKSSQFSVTADTLSVLGDADTFPANSQVRCFNTNIAQQVSHIPVSDQFVCYTFLSGEATPAMQLFICKNANEVYFRRKWTTWGTWERLAFASEAENLADRFSAYKNYAFGAVTVKDGHYLRAITNITAGAFNSEQWESSNVQKSSQFSVTADTLSQLGDADTFPANSQVRCMNTSIAQQVSHIPVSTQFVCYTFLSGEATPAMQLFVCNNANEVYFRRKWSTWGTWERLAFASEAGNDGVNVLGAFDNIVAIGDSLTYSQVYTGESTKRQAKHTWPEILATYCGANYQVIAQPGYTAADAWTLVNVELVQKDNGIAIIYLGTNSGLTETLDTDAPSNLPYTEWASTNTGCFAKIIAKAQSLGYKVMLLKPWSTSGRDDSSLEHTNATINAAATRFGCAVVEPFRASDVKYHYYPDLSGSNNAHYNDLGYSWFATKLITEVAKLGNDNMKFIIPS